ncbi:hypothetical protein J2810_004436 [Chryseobacterium rhizosphaerae]|uniref:hypothetical protein n=1 Tax=Chryseobacterium rhizosphaerae TaxID=395937 RepID=UPI0028604E58|nr:hypothetical protein [Chryseobacterium rhizosphaerae]MDR6548346.1 hypothetical protein [Chryseobacterium rhizosphaerae]
MKNITLALLTIFCLFSCKQKQKKKNTFSLDYIKNGNELSLIFENNTSQNIIFPVPNTLHFGDTKTKKFTSIREGEGFPPITVYAVVEPNKSYKLYQKKLDSIRDNYFLKKGMSDVIKEIKPEDGNTILYLKAHKIMIVKFDLTIKQGIHQEYSSKFKQNYYPYDKVLKGNYPEGEYLRRFSKLNFGKAKFMAQPVIEDSLFLNISQNDANK